LVVFFVFRKKDPKKAPTSNTQLVAEQVIDGFDNFASEMTGGKLQKAYPYFFTVFLMIAMGTVFGLLGFENPATSLMYTFGLATISFLGIFVVGITANGI
jgi:F-type H+-transporting ATPase subunit a